MFVCIHFQRELEYISVPQLSQIISDCILSNNPIEWLGVGYFFGQQV